MRRLVYFVASTVDGFIAGPDGSYDFFVLHDDVLAYMGEHYPETVPTHLRAPEQRGAPNRVFDTVLMGRHTYEPALKAGITSPYAHLRQYVVSRSLPAVDDPGVELVRDDPAGLVRRLKAEDAAGDIWLCGGGDLAGQLLPEIDELVLKRYPVVAGGGVPAIAGGFGPRRFTPVETRTFSHGGTVTTYRAAA